MPTQEQSVAAAFLCQLLSNLYQPIQVFRYEAKFKTTYIQAGMRDEIALVIDEEAFQAAMEVVMSRRNPTKRHPYPYTLTNPEKEVEAILREHLDRAE